MSQRLITNNANKICAAITHYMPRLKMHNPSRLTGLIRPIFWLLASMFLGHPAYGDQETEQWGKMFKCEADDAQNLEACKALDLFVEGEIPAETPIDGVRLVDVGYLANPDGSLENQLIVIEFSWSRDFHKKLYFPNKICAIFVAPSEEGEDKLIAEAIKELRDHKIPVDNPAYQWAMDHEISLEDCRSLDKNADETALVSETGNWSLTTSAGQYIFVAKSWSNNLADLVLLHRIDD